MASLKSMGLILLSLLLLCIPGILYNNLSASGLTPSPSATITCSSDSNYPICQVNGNYACQLNSAYCTLSGNSISFFNSKSPFTQLLDGNLFALFTNLNPLTSSGASQNSWSGSHGPFDITGNPIYYSADCQGVNATASLSQTNWSLGKCTQTNTDGSNVTEANVATWNNWNTNWNTTVALQFYQVGNATFDRSCTWLAQINYTAIANGPGYTYYGCTINQAGSVQVPATPQGTPDPTHRSWGMLIAIPVSYGKMPPCKLSQHCTTVHVSAFVQLTNWFTQSCVPNTPLGPYNSQTCQNFLQGFKGIILPGTSTTFVPNSTGAIIFGFLAGIILLVGGLGLQLGVGGGVSAGTNEQGTRIFQALGIGLIVWTFLYSEFATWFTSGLLPFGFDGAFGIISILLSGMFFMGILWRALSYD